jgi:hypothetical protein
MQLPSSLRTLQASHRPLPGFPTLDQLATHTAARIAMPHSQISTTRPAGGVGDVPAIVNSTVLAYPLWTLLSMASAGASAFHGYRRNQSVGWAVAWGAAGAVFPVITPAIAVAQGFGERAKK